MTWTVCTVCGTPGPTNRCEQHRTPDTRNRGRRGRDSQWDRLSKRARQMQPFCLDCGTHQDLQADHTPEAWRRKEQGLAIRLQDIAVRCGPCNRKAGAARGPKITRTH